jgi:hypothetical protein
MELPLLASKTLLLRLFILYTTTTVCTFIAIIISTFNINVSSYVFCLFYS